MRSTRPGEKTTPIPSRRWRMSSTTSTAPWNLPGSTMTGRIITVRHGRPDLDRDLTITAREYGDWWSQYDASGLAAEERPPESLLKISAGAATILSSTLPRAIETARHIAGATRTVPADPIFVEAPLPPPPFPDFIKLRPGQWGVVSRTMWFMRRICPARSFLNLWMSLFATSVLFP